MSVITNKDRINENNDRINRLIALVKQKALTSNPKFATTEDEMDAMITDKHVGKVVKYLGEGGGVAVGTPIAVGDTLDKLYFNTSVTPDFDALSYEYDETSDGMRTRSVTILNLASYEGALVINRMSGDNGHAEIIASGSMQFYINGEGNVGGMEMTPETFGLTAFGWQTDIFDMTQYADQSEFSDTTVATVNQQDLWSGYISKEPFASGGKYEKNALYIIAEGESEVIENPTSVGDEVTQVYFDTTKSNEEILQAIQSLDWDNPDYSGDGKAINLFVEAQGGTKGMNIMAMEGDLFEDGTIHTVYMIGQSGDYVWMYSSTVSAEAMGIEAWGWVQTSPYTLQEPFTINHIGHKDIWGAWLSAHENGFASVGAPAAPRARRLNITEGSLAINENGKFDVSNMESVDINIKPYLMTAAAEDEMTALLVEENLGQVVKYVGEAELVGTPFTEGDTVDKVYFDISKEPDLASLTYPTDGDAIGTAGILQNEDGGFILAVLNTSLIPDFGSNAYVIMAGEGNFVYASEDVDALGISKGWNTELVQTDGSFTYEESDTVATIDQQDLWSSYISKEPFASTYETDGLYVIEEGGANGTPVSVGDTITNLYFNTSAELDFFGGLTYSDGYCPLIYGQDDLILGACSLEDGRYFLVHGDATFLYANADMMEEIGISAGYTDQVVNGVFTLPIADTVTEVAQQDIWGAFISKESFVSGDALKAKSLVAPEGSLGVGANGTYDVTDKEKVVVNIKPRLSNLGVSSNGTYNATESGFDGYSSVDVYVPLGRAIEISTEEEMSAALTSNSLHTIFKYTGTTGTYTNGNMYIIEGASVDGTLTKVFKTLTIAE